MEVQGQFSEESNFSHGSRQLGSNYAAFARITILTRHIHQPLLVV